MNLLSKLTTKAKFLILISWTVLLLLITIVVTVINNQFKVEVSYDDYGTVPYDENLTLTLGAYENRASSLATANQKNSLENSKYTFFVFITKPEVSGYDVIAKYLNCQLIVKTQEGKFVYETETKGDTATGSTAAMSASLKKYTFNFSSIVKKELANVSESITSVNETPSEVYVNLYYIITKENKETKAVEKVEKNLTYKVALSDVTTLSYDKTELKEVSVSGTKANLVQTEKDFINLSITYEEKSGISTANKPINETIKFAISQNTANLKEGETIKSIKLEIIGSVDNDPADRKEQFANKVLLGAYYGYISTNQTIKEISNTLDVNYNLSELNIFITVETTLETKTLGYKIPVANL